MEEPYLQKKDSNGTVEGTTFGGVLRWCGFGSLSREGQPRSGERMQPTAQAVASLNQEVESAPEGAKESYCVGRLTNPRKFRAIPAARDANSNPSLPPPSSPHTSTSRLPNSCLPRYRARKTPAPQSRHTITRPCHSNSWDTTEQPNPEAKHPADDRKYIPQSSTHPSA